MSVHHTPVECTVENTEADRAATLRRCSVVGVICPSPAVVAGGEPVVVCRRSLPLPVERRSRTCSTAAGAPPLLAPLTPLWSLSVRVCWRSESGLVRRSTIVGLPSDPASAGPASVRSALR
eukprot:scaffold130055_cov63-Phaeocystis_antarctica.AAC.1